MSADRRPGGSAAADGDRLDDRSVEPRSDELPVGAGTGTGEETPMFRIVRGAPTGEELAALAVVLATASVGGPPPTADRTMDGWAARWRNLMVPRPRGVTWGRN